jgi:hypothetical protein
VPLSVSAPPDVWQSVANVSMVLALLALCAGLCAALILSTPPGGGDACDDA